MQVKDMWIVLFFFRNIFLHNEENSSKLSLIFVIASYS